MISTYGSWAKNYQCRSCIVVRERVVVLSYRSRITRRNTNIRIRGCLKTIYFVRLVWAIYKVDSSQEMMCGCYGFLFIWILIWVYASPVYFIPNSPYSASNNASITMPSHFVAP